MQTVQTAVQAVAVRAAQRQHQLTLVLAEQALQVKALRVLMVRAGQGVLTVRVAAVAGQVQ
jgi:hypothetical protein